MRPNTTRPSQQVGDLSATWWLGFRDGHKRVQRWTHHGGYYWLGFRDGPIMLSETPPLSGNGVEALRPGPHCSLNSTSPHRDVL